MSVLPARPTGRSNRRRVLLAAVAVLPVGLGALGLGALAPVQAETATTLRLGFDGPTLLEQSGTAVVEVRAVTSGPEVTPVAVPDLAGGSAARLPEFLPTGAAQAGFSVVDVDGADDLNPGKRTFRFGADFALDAVGQVSIDDNGNNLIQRGLADNRNQYKLQVDGIHPSCRIKGNAGAITVSSRAVVVPGTWYRAWCERDGNRVTLQVTRLSDGYTWTRSVYRNTGEVTLSAQTPLTVGVKMSSPTTIAPPSADQFNGTVDEAFLQVTD